MGAGDAVLGIAWRHLSNSTTGTLSQMKGTNMSNLQIEYLKRRFGLTEAAAKALAAIMWEASNAD